MPKTVRNKKQFKETQYVVADDQCQHSMSNGFQYASFPWAYKLTCLGSMIAIEVKLTIREMSGHMRKSGHQRSSLLRESTEVCSRLSRL